MDDSLLLDLNDFKIIRKLGNGACGDVYLVKEKSSAKLFAAKVSRVECKSLSDQKSFFREILSLSKAKHPAVLSLIGFNLTNFEGDHYPTIVTEFMPKGSLGDILNGNINLPQSKRYIILLGIAEGMKYLHSIGITHRDLKPGNIVLDDNFYPYISDFGASKLANSNQDQNNMESIVGTPLYMAPEIFASEQYTNKIDIYSFSLVMYQLITGRLPQITSKNNFREIVRAITEGKRPDLTIIEDEEVKSFLSKCWSPNPSERPEFSQIVDEIKTRKYLKLMNVNFNDVKEYIQLFERQPIQDGTYYITSSSNTFCVSVINEKGLLSSEEKFKGLKQSFNVITNDDGTISLRSNFNNCFVMTNLNHQNELIAAALSNSKWEKYIIEMKSDGKIALKSASNSKYLNFDLNDGNALKSNSEQYKLFTFNELNSIKEGEYFIESASNNKIISIENNQLISNKACLIGSNEIFQIKHNLEDGTISLKSMATKKYVSADLTNEDSNLLAKSNRILKWEKFILVPISTNEFGLLSLANDKYVMTDLNNGSKLRAVTEKVAGSWEIFKFHELNSLKEGNYFIKSHSNGKIVSTENGSEESIVSSKDNFENVNEAFFLIHNAEDATVSFKSLSNGRYVSVMLNSDKSLMPLAKKADLCEKFILVPVNDSKVEFALKSVVNGKFVMADLTHNSVLRAVTDTIAGSWEVYTFYEI